MVELPVTLSRVVRATSQKALVRNADRAVQLTSPCPEPAVGRGTIGSLVGSPEAGLSGRAASLGRRSGFLG